MQALVDIIAREIYRGKEVMICPHCGINAARIWITAQDGCRHAKCRACGYAFHEGSAESVSG